MKSFPLLDKQFLDKLIEENQKELYVKIISPNLDEEPIDTIEGRVTGGTVNIDGASAVRRSCNLTLTTEEVNINSFYWGLTNKFKLFIGLLNTVDARYDDIIWFPQGVYVINNFKINYVTKNPTISISGKDKMCLLNGEISGQLPAMIDFATEEYYDEEGNKIKKDLTIKQIITSMIHAYGNEPYHNIIIKDVDNKGLELLQYLGKSDIFLFKDCQTEEYINVAFGEETEKYLAETGEKISLGSSRIIYYSLSPQADNTGATRFKDTRNKNDYNEYWVVKCSYGEAVGYRVTDLTWPKKDGLIANVGTTITSILDEIVKMFGVYEYFYDVDGHFVFQKKLTYLNTAWNNIIKMDDNEVHTESSKLVSQYVYNFSNSILIQAFENTPDFNKIKNDFSVWGKKPAVSKNSDGIDIHMRYAINTKPIKYVSYDGTTWATPSASIEYKKKPNPNGLPEEWWDVQDWADYYKLCTGEYPTRAIGTYCTEGGINIDLNTLFGRSDIETFNEAYSILNWNIEQIVDGSYGAWFDDWQNMSKIYVFDVINKNGKKTLGYTGHRDGCGHSYSYFLQAQSNGIQSFIYRPQLPTDVIDHLKVDWREIIYQMALDFYNHGQEEDFAITIARNNPEYPYGKTGYEQYYTDMLGFWRQLYNLAPSEEEKENYFVGALEEKERKYLGWNKIVMREPSSLKFWIDFIDPQGGELSQYNVKAIGSRANSVNDTDVKSIIYNETPSIVYITAQAFNDLQEAGEVIEGYNYVNLPEQFLEYFSIEKQGKSAQQKIDELMYQSIYVNENITLKSIPIYYLEPNTKITVDDNVSNIHGEYIINKISISLDHKGAMTINASKAPIRLY